MTVTPRPDFRILPRLTDANEHFWTSGQDGVLRFTRCQSCGYWLHPSGPICPTCHSKDLAPEAVSGEAVVHTYTVNHQAWIPGVEVPYVVAIVELEEQSDLRLMTDLPRTPIEDVRIGLPVKVFFEEIGKIWLPQFEAA